MCHKSNKAVFFFSALGFALVFLNVEVVFSQKNKNSFFSGGIPTENQQYDNSTGAQLGWPNNQQYGQGNQQYGQGNQQNWQDNSQGWQGPMFRGSTSNLGCPFMPGQEASAITSSLQSAISSLESQQRCQTSSQTSGSTTLQRNLSELKQVMTSTASCSRLSFLQRERNLAFALTQNFSGAELPNTFASCDSSDSGDLLKSCVESTYQIVARSLEISCQEESKTQESAVLSGAAATLRENVANDITRLIDNQNCNGSDAVSGLMGASIQAIPFLTSHSLGYGAAQSIGSALLTSILNRLNRSPSDSQRFQSLLQEEQMRCLYYSTLKFTVSSACGLNENPVLGQPVRPEILSFANVLNSVSQEVGRVPVNQSALLQALTQSVKIPGRNSSAPFSSLVQELLETKKRVLLQMTSSEVGGNFNPSRAILADFVNRLEALVSIGQGATPTLNQQLPSANDFLGNMLMLVKLNLPVDQSRELDTAVLRARDPASSVRVLPNTNVTEGLRLITANLLRGTGPSNVYSGVAVQRRQRIVAQSTDTENRKQEMKNLYLQCLYNTPMLMTNERRIRAVSTGQFFEPKIRENFSEYQSLCSQFSCIRPSVAAQATADQMREWQCKNFKEQVANDDVFEASLRSWNLSGGNAGGFCANLNSRPKSGLAPSNASDTTVPGAN